MARRTASYLPEWRAGRSFLQFEVSQPRTRAGGARGDQDPDFPSDKIGPNGSDEFFDDGAADRGVTQVEGHHRLYAEQPRGGLQGMGAGQLIELVSGVYGLGDAASHFRKGLKRDLVELGYRHSTLDPTVVMLFLAGDALDTL
eukprot:2927765-Pyramimonas_sp.AAC.1